MSMTVKEIEREQQRLIREYLAQWHAKVLPMPPRPGWSWSEETRQRERARRMEREQDAWERKHA